MKLKTIKAALAYIICIAFVCVSIPVSASWGGGTSLIRVDVTNPDQKNYYPLSYYYFTDGWSGTIIVKKTFFDNFPFPEYSLLHDYSLLADHYVAPCRDIYAIICITGASKSCGWIENNEAEALMLFWKDSDVKNLSKEFDVEFLRWLKKNESIDKNDKSLFKTCNALICAHAKGNNGYFTY